MNSFVQSHVVGYMKYKVYVIEPSTRSCQLYTSSKVIQVSSQAWDCTNEENGAAGGSVLDF